MRDSKSTTVCLRSSRQSKPASCRNGRFLRSRFAPPRAGLFLPGVWQGLVGIGSDVTPATGKVRRFATRPSCAGRGKRLWLSEQLKESVESTRRIHDRSLSCRNSASMAHTHSSSGRDTARNTLAWFAPTAGWRRFRHAFCHRRPHLAEKTPGAQHFQGAMDRSRIHSQTGSNRSP